MRLPTPQLAVLVLVHLLVCPPPRAAADEPAEVLLWPNGAPGSEGKDSPEILTRNSAGVVWRINNIHKPSIRPYLPPADKATGAAVVVMAGGGHRDLNIGPEGYDIGQWLAERGVAAFVLKYRLGREKDTTYKWEVEGVADAQRAVRLVRSRAKEWNVDPARVGVLGFSAGGELAYMVSQRPGEGASEAADPVDRESARPAFQALLYPGTPKNIMPTKDTPQAFMAVGFRDRTSEPLALAYTRFMQAGVPAELHVYANAGHPDGFRERDRTPASKWPERFMEWLDGRGFLEPAAAAPAPAASGKTEAGRAPEAGDGS